MHDFRNWLIRWLGGTPSEGVTEILHDAAQITKVHSDELRQQANEIHYLREQLKISQERNIDLQELIFNKFGVRPVSGTESQSGTREVKPIQTMSRPWAKVRQDMEARDRAMAENASRIQEQHKGKDVIPMSPDKDESVELFG